MKAETARWADALAVTRRVDMYCNQYEWSFMSKKKLLLINPVNTARSGFSVNRSSRFPPLGLGVVAALTSPEWDVQLLDENFAPFEYRDTDLVGITAFTSAANRAYEIAAVYRAKGIPVVMGGIHASMCPDEAEQFVDSVVIGEAESVWAQVLTDLRRWKITEAVRGGLARSQDSASTAA